ncbi:maleylpyruvate isomerase N-terminal domain-containing protein [Actinophytocola sp.]|uniref:maleylpyruvate isomerase N-terminal domain-containing protein n=1 Tax=Actinophytocola sp. TaxID=1872138 RepID=UPI003899C3F6
MEFDVYLDQIREQAAALRAAAVRAGQDAEVPTAPGWTVLRLVRHIGRVHNWVVLSLDAGPDGEDPVAARPPERWDDALAFWDDQVDAMLAGLRERGPDAPARTFRAVGTTGWWARRQAHESAIHRLDAEHAAHGDAVDHLVFDPAFAADGIDEALTFMIGRRPATADGTVLYHAADAGRAWLVTATADAPPRGTELDGGAESGLDVDASVVGTADAVYRAVWKRPSHAVIGGNRTLVDGIQTP